MIAGPRQPALILLLAIVPALALALTMWAYQSLVEGMRKSLHEQRGKTLRAVTLEDAPDGRLYAVANVPAGAAELAIVAGEWPETIDIDVLRSLKAMHGLAAEQGIEYHADSRTTYIVWILDRGADGWRVGVQNRRTFYARLDSLSGIIWLAGLLLVGGTFLLFVILARNFSEVFFEMELKNQELERANRHLEELGVLKSTFLALVSHELRTPLARVAGHLNLLRQTAHLLPEDVRQRFTDMSIEVDDLARMTKNALDLTRLQSEDLAARMELSQITPLLRSLTEKVQAIAQARGVAIEAIIPETPAVFYDSYLLERVLDNLLINAVKYSEKGGVIRLEVVEQEARLLVYVESFGTAIPETYREKIFEKFFRVDEETNVPGSGLGLYLVRAFLLMMSGRVWVEPLANGNRFVFSLPFP